MRAVVAQEYGGPEVLQIADVATPEPAAGEVRVRVAAAGTNPVDAVARSGAIADWFGAPPYIWGWDVAGVIDGLGAGVATLSIGDPVFGMPRFPAIAGAYAEYVVAPVGELARLPGGADQVAAAALPLAGLTALQTLDRTGPLDGRRVLVHGAGGGVGHLAVQLAIAAGAHVIASARPRHHAFLAGLGAAEVTASPADAGPVDVVVDCVGDDGLLSVVRPGGAFARVPGAAQEPDALEVAAAEQDVRVVRHVVHPDGAGLARLADLVGDGHLDAEVAGTLPLAEAAEAHRRLEAGVGRGALVLVVSEPDPR